MVQQVHSFVLVCIQSWSKPYAAYDSGLNSLLDPRNVGT